MAQLQKAAFAVFLAQMEEDLRPVPPHYCEAFNDLVATVAMITTVHKLYRNYDHLGRLFRIGCDNFHQSSMTEVRRLPKTIGTKKSLFNMNQLKRWWQRLHWEGFLNRSDLNDPIEWPPIDRSRSRPAIEKNGRLSRDSRLA